MKRLINNLVIRIFGYSDISSGYIAISSVLVIAVVVLIIGTTVSLVSISEGQISLSGIKNGETLDILEGCAEETLLYLNENKLVPSTITLPEGTCTTTVNSQSATNWTVTLTTTLSGYSKSVRIVLTRNSTITITSWEEI